MVGKEIGVSSWHLIDQARIDTYADVVEDHQFIHVDPERAKKEAAFGTTIAHGFLTMSLMSIMSYEVMPVIAGTAMGVNYGFDKLRFISPVRSGKRVRGRFVLAEATLRKPKELQSRTNVTVEISDNPLAARFDENDAVIWFEDVKVPWERVFVYRDTDMCRAQFHDTLGHTFQNYQAQIRLTVKVRFLVGVAHRLAETIGTVSMPPVREVLGRLAAQAAMVEGMVAG